MNKIIIFLDFDGVLCNSVKEAYLLARYAYYNTDVYHPINKTEFNTFKKYRYLITNSWQYYLLLSSIKNNTDIEDSFKKLNLIGQTQDTKSFNDIFLSKRKELMEKDFDFWNNLETPTSFLLKIKNHLNERMYAILSTKNKTSIIAKLRSWNIKINDNLIFGKEILNNTTKGEFINTYLSNNAITKAILVDDSYENLKTCNPLNTRVLLASWGYVSKERLGLTEEEILTILLEGDKQ